MYCLVCEGFPYIGEYYPKSGYHYHTQTNYDRSYIPYRRYTDTDFNMHHKKYQQNTYDLNFPLVNTLLSLTWAALEGRGGVEGSGISCKNQFL